MGDHFMLSQSTFHMFDGRKADSVQSSTHIAGLSPPKLLNKNKENPGSTASQKLIDALDGMGASSKVSSMGQRSFRLLPCEVQNLESVKSSIVSEQPSRAPQIMNAQASYGAAAPPNSSTKTTLVSNLRTKSKSRSPMKKSVTPVHQPMPSFLASKPTTPDASMLNDSAITDGVNKRRRSRLQRTGNRSSKARGGRASNLRGRPGTGTCNISKDLISPDAVAGG